jgi:hypothetical protein
MTDFRPFYSENNSTDIKFTPTVTVFGTIGNNINDDNISFLKKYTPKHTKDIFKNKDNIYSIKKWIEQKLNGEKTYPFILLIGNVGCGKSEMLKLCFLECDCSVIEYDTEIKKATYDNLKESIVCSSIELLLRGGVRKSGIIIDNVQNTLPLSYKKNLLKLLQTESCAPVIFTTSSRTKLSEVLRAKGLVLDFDTPTVEDFIKLGSKICKKEKIKISQSALQHLVYSSKFDIRNFINSLGFIGIQKNKNKKINQKDIQKLCKTLEKDLNLNIQDTFQYITNPKIPFPNKCIFTSLYTSSIISDNYMSYLPTKTKKEDTIETLENIETTTDWISHGDILTNHMFHTQGWEHNELINTTCTLGPLSALSKYINTKKPIVIKSFNKKNPSIINKSLSHYKINEIMYSILHILLRPTEINGKVNTAFLLEKIKTFYDFMKKQSFSMETSIKLFNLTYKSVNIPSKDIKRIGSKIKKYWIEVES